MVPTPRQVIDRYFAAMERGADAAEELFALFADDAVYSEPFTGGQTTHTGRAAIESQLLSGWQQTPPDLAITVDRIDVEGQVVTSHWTCTSPVFPAPIKGRDVCTVRDGKICALDVRMLP